MLNKMRWIFLLTGLGFISACESTGSGVTIDAPMVDLNCSTSKCAVAGFRDAYVVLTRSGCAEDQIGFETVATGTEQLICSGSSCSGTVTQWAPSTIESRTYYVCGWIDIDNTGTKTSADAFSEDQLFVSGSTLTITNWSVSYFILRKRR